MARKGPNKNYNLITCRSNKWIPYSNIIRAFIFRCILGADKRKKWSKCS